MEILELYRRGELLGRYELGLRHLELGRASDCDIVVHDAAVAERHWLFSRRHGSVFAFDVAGDKRARSEGRPLPLGNPWPIGHDHAVRRVGAEAPSLGPARAREATTEPLHAQAAAAARFALLLGRGGEARRIAVDQRLIEIGRSAESDLTLHDPAVSERHARIEPAERAVWLRDLGSRNGTFVDGMLVRTAALRHGSLIRVGRTELRLVALTHSGDAGSPIIAESGAMLDLLGEVQRMAALTWPVLVVGESGSGKEGIAQALHARGPRSERPFVAINAGGLPRELIESELFGHERGAFTGAAQAHRGVFEQAHGGTLFLDELGELPLALQARLLRVLETHEIRRVGGERSLAVDVRLVCATHRDLRAMIAAGSFRRDLYYRITQLMLEVPALRARPEDIAPLASHFLRQIAGELGARELTPDGLTRLLAYRWPGNARELRNVLCYAAANSAHHIDASAIERALDKLGDVEPSGLPAGETCRAAVAQYRGNKAAAARALGIPRSTLRDRLRRSGE